MVHLTKTLKGLAKPSNWLTIPNLAKSYIYLTYCGYCGIPSIFLLQETTQTPERSYLVINILLVGNKWSFSLSGVKYIYFSSKLSFSMQWPHVVKYCFIKVKIFPITFRISSTKLFYKLNVLKHFAKVTGKHLCRSLLLMKMFSC